MLAARAGRRLSCPCTNPASSVVLLTGSASLVTHSRQLLPPRQGEVRGLTVGAAARAGPGEDSGAGWVQAAAPAPLRALPWRDLLAGSFLPQALPSSSPSQPFSLQAPSGFLWTEDRLPVGFPFFFPPAQSRRTKKELYHLDNQTTREC